MNQRYLFFFLDRRCILVFIFNNTSFAISIIKLLIIGLFFFSMSNCKGMNFTGIDAYYANKIQSGDKSWAWWLNNLG